MQIQIKIIDGSTFSKVEEKVNNFLMNIIDEKPKILFQTTVPASGVIFYSYTIIHKVKL